MSHLNRILLALFFVAGCSSSQLDAIEPHCNVPMVPYLVLARDDIPRDPFMQACEAWNARCPVFRCRYLDAEVFDEMIGMEGVVTMSAKLITRCGDSYDPEGRRTMGCCRIRFIVEERAVVAHIDISTRALHDEQYTYAVIVHELGHVIGLGHDEDRSSCMYRAVNPFCFIQPEDLAHASRYCIP